MKYSDSETKRMPSLSYTEYVEGIQSYECQDCKIITYPHVGHCAKCIETNLKQLLVFCCECKTPIEYKSDYFLNNNAVSELRKTYLLCNCTKGLWLPLVKDSSILISDFPNEVLIPNEDPIWYLCNPNPSKYANNDTVHFTKCDEKEEKHFLRSYIESNIDPDQRMGGELRSFSRDFYKLCNDTINLNLKLGLFNVFLDNRFGYYNNSFNSKLKNSIHDLVQYSSPIFWSDYVSTYFDSCIVRIYRLLDENTKEHTNSYRRYSNRYLEFYPEKKKKSGIGKIDNRLAAIRKQFTAHDDTQFNPEIITEDIEVIYDFYTNKVLKSINTLNDMQGLKIVFSYDPRKTILDKGFAKPILKMTDNDLERYKQETNITTPK